MSRQRLSVSVESELVEAAEAAAASGRAPTVSAWVNDALRLKLEHERRLDALAAFIHAYEAEHGTISVEEIRQAGRRASSRAVPVREMIPSGKPGRRRGSVKR